MYLQVISSFRCPYSNTKAGCGKWSLNVPVTICGYVQCPKCKEFTYCTKENHMFT